MTTTRRGLLGGAALLGAGLLAGCTAAPSAPTPSPTRTGYGGVPLTRAAEPGDAPEPTEAPAGRVIPLPEDGRPWGVAVSGGTAYVALRGPARLAVVDLAQGAVRTVPMVGSARMIDLAGDGGPLLYPAESANRLLELALPSLEVTRSVPTRRQPHQAVQVGDEVWISEEFGHAVRVVRGDDVLADLPQPVQPGGITAAAGRVAVVDVAANLLFVYDAASRDLVAALPAGEGPSHVVPTGGSRVAVCDVRGNAVLTFDIGGEPRRLGRAAVPGRAFWIEADAGSGTVYTALADANLIARLRLNGAGAPVLDGTMPTVRQPISFDLAGGDLAIAGYAGSQLQVAPTSAFG
ncbi:YncE family protein [Amnibacterium endophyticum]|uniref:YncE family protein n=1 Tax=Amnibacterium endophyticum TaxID=2109337 RepID=A0ABW4LFQ0_9MICO